MKRATRRGFLASAGAAATLPIMTTEVRAAEGTARIRNPIAVSSYSFWRFRDDSKLSMERCIDLASEMGFDAFEVLRQDAQPLGRTAA